MDKAYIVCDSPQGTQFYKDFLKQNRFTDIRVFDNGQEARQRYLDYECDVCIVNSPLRGEMCEDLAIDLAQKNIGQVILVVKAEILEQVTERVEDYGIITVGKPINKQMFWSALSMARAAQRRIEMVHKETKRLQKKIDEMKYVSRAKVILITNEGMTEEEAHRYIEKNAMDRRLSRGEIAKEILEEFDY